MCSSSETVRKKERRKEAREEGTGKKADPGRHEHRKAEG